SLRVDDEEDQIAVFDRLVNRAGHQPVHHALRALRVPRRVHENSLVAVLIQNAEDAMPRRVRLGADDTDFLADQGVQQGRFADVWTSDDRDEAGAGLATHAHGTTPRASRPQPAARRAG